MSNAYMKYATYYHSKERTRSFAWCQHISPHHQHHHVSARDESSFRVRPFEAHTLIHAHATKKIFLNISAKLALLIPCVVWRARRAQLAEMRPPGKHVVHRERSICVYLPSAESFRRLHQHQHELKLTRAQRTINPIPPGSKSIWFCVYRQPAESLRCLVSENGVDFASARACYLVNWKIRCERTRQEHINVACSIIQYCHAHCLERERTCTNISLGLASLTQIYILGMQHQFQCVDEHRWRLKVSGLGRSSVIGLLSAASQKHPI